MLKAIGNFFRKWQRASRPTWEYRLRYATEVNGWVIETCEHSNEHWVTLHERTAATPYSETPVRYDTYADARQGAIEKGMDNAYEEVRYIDARRVTPLTENQKAIATAQHAEIPPMLRAPSSAPSFANAAARGGTVRPLRDSTAA